MNQRALHDGQRDGLVPLESLSIREVSTFPQLLRAMSKTDRMGVLCQSDVKFPAYPEWPCVNTALTL